MYNPMFNKDISDLQWADTLSIHSTVIGNVYQINEPNIELNKKIDVLHKNFYR